MDKILRFVVDLRNEIKDRRRTDTKTVVYFFNSAYKIRTFLPWLENYVKQKNLIQEYAMYHQNCNQYLDPAILELKRFWECLFLVSRGGNYTVVSCQSASTV